MRFLIPLSITAAVLGVAALRPAEARSVGGASGGRGIAAFSTRAGPVAHGLPSFVRRPQLSSNRLLHPPLHEHQFARTIPMTIPWWGSIRPGDWWPGYGYQLPQQVQASSAQPQITIIGGGSEGRVAETPETTPDYSYVPGCHAIPNGYHCDVPSEAH